MSCSPLSYFVFILLSDVFYLHLIPLYFIFIFCLWLNFLIGKIFTTHNFRSCSIKINYFCNFYSSYMAIREEAFEIHVYKLIINVLHIYINKYINRIIDFSIHPFNSQIFSLGIVHWCWTTSDVRRNVLLHASMKSIIFRSAFSLRLD